MAICASQAVITSLADNVTGQSVRNEESMTAGRRETEPELMPECGRLVFRGIELAYLNINGKQMLPLAEMLALVFRSTPRTTLFTRMEKINAKRHFCQPLEIKLLKTVNGIHGSSANCTLITKEDVERYCSIYIDREVEEPAPCRDPRKDKKGPRKDDCSEIKIVKTKNSAKLDKVAEAATLENKADDHTIKELKVANAASNSEARKINTMLAEAQEACTRTETNNNGEAGENSADNDDDSLPSPLSQEQEHASNSTQTISMLSWSTQKHANNVVEVNKNAKLERTKKRKRVDGAVDQFNSPSKEQNKLQEQGGMESNSTGKSPKPRKRSCVALTLNLDSGISDDSGFTSLTLEDCTTPTKVGKKGPQPKLKCDVTSPHRFQKKESSSLELSDKLNLSPPPLVIKKHQNTWQVETKLEGVKKKLYKRKKQKLAPKKMPEGRVVNGLLETYSKQASKRKINQKKLSITGQGINLQSPASIVNKELIAAGTDGQGGVGKQKRRRRKFAETVVSEAVNRITPTLGLECFAAAEKKKKKKVGKKGPKESKIGGKVDNLVSSSSNGRGQLVPQSKPLKHAAPSGMKLTPVKPPVLKATPNFSLMDLFPTTAGLIVYDGDLCPEFTMAPDPNAAKPLPSHPIWKWRIGGPVIAKTHKVSFRIRKIKQPNSNAKLSTAEHKSLSSHNQVKVGTKASSSGTADRAASL